MIREWHARQFVPGGGPAGGGRGWLSSAALLAGSDRLSVAGSGAPAAGGGAGPTGRGGGLGFGSAAKAFADAPAEDVLYR